LSGSDASSSTVTDQAGKQRRSITNGIGQLVRVDEPDDTGNLGSIGSPVQPTSYSYDTLNNLVQVNQGVQQRNFSYNSLSRLLTATNPESGQITYNYDNNGNLINKTDARGVVTNYVYDNINRVTSRNYSDGTPTVSYVYDNLPNAKGRLTQVSSSISTTNYNQFDNLGRVLASQQITDGQTYNFGYSYNLAGMLVNQTYPSGRVVTNQFETDGDLAQVVGAFNNQNKTYAGNFNYTSAGAVSAMQLGNGKWENTVFNSRLQPIQIGLGNSNNSQELWKVNYDYGTTDNNGNVKSQQITVPSQFTANQVYTYDSLNRLKSARETISNSETWKQTFTFDRYGNRKFDANQTTTLGNCPQNVCNPDINLANNRVVGANFDNAGNTTQDAEGRQFFYDAENKQKEVKNAQNQVIGQYLYDGDGKRVKKLAANDTTIFVYDAGGKLASEYTVSASQSQAPQTSYLTNDTLGSPRVTTDASGNVVSRRDFRPYGEEIYRQGQGTDKVRQKFTSYERDNETDLDFAQARMYQSKLGRFITADPLYLELKRLNNPAQLNLYSYSINNPLKHTDPSGLEIELIFKNKKERDAYLNEVNKTLNGRYKVEVKNGKLSVVGGEKAIAKIDKTKLNNGQALFLDAVTNKSQVGKVDLGDGKPNDSIHVAKYDSPGVNKIDTTDFNKVKGGGMTVGEILIHESSEAYYTAGGTSQQQAHDDITQLGVGGLYNNLGISPIPNSADGGATITGYTINNTWLSGRGRSLNNPVEPGAMQHVFKFDTPIPKADWQTKAGTTKATFQELVYNPNFKPE
jgi:RHS repeat-associated protein